MAFAIWLFHFCLWYQYAATRPRRSDASSGRLYPLNAHGTVVYLNKDEDERLTGLTVFTVGLFVTAFAIHGVLVDGFFRRAVPWEKKQW